MVRQLRLSTFALASCSVLALVLLTALFWPLVRARLFGPPFFYTHEQALNQFAVQVERGLIPIRKAGVYDIGTLPNGAFDAAFITCGHLAVVKYGITPDDSIEMLVYCPNGCHPSDESAFIGGPKTPRKILKMSEKWLYVLF
jgi:hypothetical protein